MLSSPRHDVFLLMSLTQPHWLTQTSCASSHLSHTHPVSPASWLLFMLALRALAGFRTGPGRPVPAAGTGAYAWGRAQVPGQSLRFLARNCSRVHLPWWCVLGEAQGIRAASKWGCTHCLSHSCVLVGSGFLSLGPPGSWPALQVSSGVRGWFWKDELGQPLIADR